MQGELLRQRLLLRYCGISETSDSSCKHLKNKPLTHRGTAAAAAQSDRGSLHVARAGMTLHDIQVRMLAARAVVL